MSIIRTSIPAGSAQTPFVAVRTTEFLHGVYVGPRAIGQEMTPFVADEADRPMPLWAQKPDGTWGPVSLVVQPGFLALLTHRFIAGPGQVRLQMGALEQPVDQSETIQVSLVFRPEEMPQ